MLALSNLHIKIDEKPVVRGLNLKINKGEIHAVMGPNGSGKSTLAQTLMGHPRYKVVKGSMKFLRKDLTAMKPDQRSRAGLFLAFQYPKEISGVNLIEFLRAAYSAHHPDEKTSVFAFKELLDREMERLEIDKTFANRFINNGFSGGEKKKSEMLQMAILKPKLAILDETDSGLDIDALKTVCKSVKQLMRNDMAILLITHYQRILEFIIPDFVHVLYDGQIVKSGGKELALELEEKGYDWIKEESATV